MDLGVSIRSMGGYRISNLAVGSIQNVGTFSP